MSDTSILNAVAAGTLKPRSALEAYQLLAGLDGWFFSILELERKASRGGLGELPPGGLEIAVVADGFQPGAAELGGDVLGREIEPARRRIPALEQVGGQEREVPFERVGRDPVERGGLVDGKRFFARRSRSGNRQNERTAIMMKNL